MSEIPRWTPKYLKSWEESDAMLRATHGGYVDYRDHVAAMQAVLPQPKFKVGDRVTIDKHETYTVLEEVFYDKDFDCWGYVNTQSDHIWKDSQLTLYVPPTPTKLIPTLKEHEWVRGTYKSTGIAFGPYTVYYNEIGAMFAGDNHLIHWNTGKISDELATLERCDAPEVK